VSNSGENKHVILTKSPLLPIGGSVEYRIRSKLNDEVSIPWRKIEETNVDVIILCDNTKFKYTLKSVD